MISEHPFTKKGVGRITIAGDAEGTEFTVEDIAFGEYEDLGGNRYPLSREQVVEIVSVAQEEWQAIAIALSSE